MQTLRVHAVRQLEHTLGLSLSIDVAGGKGLLERGIRFRCAWSARDPTTDISRRQSTSRAASLDLPLPRTRVRRLLSLGVDPCLQGDSALDAQLRMCFSL